MIRFLCLFCCAVCLFPSAEAQNSSDDLLRELQSSAVRDKRSSWGHWGADPSRYSSWLNHSNRLVPIYTFGITLDSLRDEGSVYADPERLERLYGQVPDGTHNPLATYFDQTDIYRLQIEALEAGFRNIVLIVFDGMDWTTTRAAALYKSGHNYQSGRGSGLAIQDERRTVTDFGLYCTSPRLAGAKIDVNAQSVIGGGAGARTTGGYDAKRGGSAPWHEQSRRRYLLGSDRERAHSVTDSASSATSMVSGIKTFNGAVNVAVDGTKIVPLPRRLQAERGFKLGVVSSVPVSHATPAASYANNVSRGDYQDLARDLIGLPSSAHRDDPLSGVDVLIGGGWGENKARDRGQGSNYSPGNRYLHENDLARVDVANGGKYVVAQRTAGTAGKQVLMAGAAKAVKEDLRLIGYFGTKGGHLPYQTADGQYNPTGDVRRAESYTTDDLLENPNLAEMTAAALHVLQESANGFWLMIEAGDVDWANHSNNLDNSIGAVLNGDRAFQVVADWADDNDAWAHTAVIVAADHGHFLVIDDPEPIIQAGRAAAAAGKR